MHFAGARCPDGASFIPTVAGSAWVPSGGIYKLVSCPQDTQLVNSASGTSTGMFSADIQHCKPCGDGRYIVDPNTDECQSCPAGFI
jgi:hypothetical protein